MAMDNKARQNFTFRIAGRDYTISSSDSPEHMRRVAVYVDRRITEVSSTGMLARESAAVVAALSIAEELMTAQDDNTRLRRELWQAKKELSGRADVP